MHCQSDLRTSLKKKTKRNSQQASQGLVSSQSACPALASPASIACAHNQEITEQALFSVPARNLSRTHQMTPPANVLITTTILLHKPGQKLCIFVGEEFIATTSLLQSLCLQHAQHHLRRSMLVDAAAFRNSNKSASSLVQWNPISLGGFSKAAKKYTIAVCSR